MPSPLMALGPALEALAKNADILPATGKAVEEPLPPDSDERAEGRMSFESRLVDLILEAPSRDLYRPTPPLGRGERHIFRYFLDGSLRTYFIGTAIERERATPVCVAQVGAAVLRREDDGTVRVAKLKTKLLLLLAKSQVSEALWGHLEGLQGPFQLVDISEDDALTKGISDLRSRASGKAEWEMHKLEAELAAEIERKEGEWLIIDGTVRFPPLVRQFEEEPRLRQLIGVAKSFSREPRFSVKEERKKVTLNLCQLLAGLPEEHRTCVFGTMEGKLAFWYVRLWEQGHLDYPLMGVVKVELPNPSGEPVPTELADELSRALVAERTVTPHGKDRRWHAHLYPIFLAEQAVKNAFFSRLVVQEAIKWPLP